MQRTRLIFFIYIDRDVSSISYKVLICVQIEQLIQILIILVQFCFYSRLSTKLDIPKLNLGISIVQIKIHKQRISILN